MKIKLLILSALGMGIFTAGTWAAAFILFLSGRYLWEPNSIIASIEMGFAVILTLLSLTALILYVRRV